MRQLKGEVDEEEAAEGNAEESEDVRGGAAEPEMIPARSPSHTFSAGVPPADVKMDVDIQICGPKARAR